MLLFFVFMMCIGSFLSPYPVFAEENSQIYVVTANKATVFAEADLTSEKLYVLNHKTEVKIEFENDNPKVYNENGFVFFKVESADNMGYVLADLVIPKTDFLETIPKFNGRTNGKATVYFLEDGKYVASEITLPKHQRIFLYEGFNRKKEYNAVAFVYENEIIYGYLKESAIDPDGVNPVIITVVCFAIAAIGIILTFVFIKKKKTKTNLPKKK